MKVGGQCTGRNRVDGAWLALSMESRVLGVSCMLPELVLRPSGCQPHWSKHGMKISRGLKSGAVAVVKHMATRAGPKGK